MKFALSTNWCNQIFATGEEIADKAIELGFDALELGFMTPNEQIKGFRNRLDEIPVESVHAFCPVPVSAPSGSPELYDFFSADDNQRAMARMYLLKTLDMAFSLGASSVVFHAGRVSLKSFFSRGFNSHTLREKVLSSKDGARDQKYLKILERAIARRKKRVDTIMPFFLREMEFVLKSFEKRNIVLAIENMPFLEGFPNEVEMLGIAELFKGAPIAAWFDTGHHQVRENHGWISQECNDALCKLEQQRMIRGMHLNDITDYYDDHLAPGCGLVPFSKYSEMASNVAHVVFEPKSHVSKDDLLKGIDFIRNVF